MKKAAFIISILTSFYSLGQKKSDKIDNDLNYNIRWAEYFFENKHAMPANQVPHKIQIRYPVEKTFNIKRPVFIGNRAKYAAYALEGGKIQNFIQGRLGQLIKQNIFIKYGISNTQWVETGPFFGDSTDFLVKNFFVYKLR